MSDYWRRGSDGSLTTACVSANRPLSTVDRPLPLPAHVVPRRSTIHCLHTDSRPTRREPAATYTAATVKSVVAAVACLAGGQMGQVPPAGLLRGDGISIPIPTADLAGEARRT